LNDEAVFAKLLIVNSRVGPIARWLVELPVARIFAHLFINYATDNRQMIIILKTRMHSMERAICPIAAVCTGINIFSFKYIQVTSLTLRVM